MPKKKKRTRPGAVAEREIRKLQNSVHLLLSTAPFRRLAREIAQAVRPDIRFAKGSLSTLQTEAEAMVVDLFKRANRCANHRGCTTVDVKDFSLARELSTTS